MTKSNRLILIFILAFALIVGLSFATPQTTRAFAVVDYSGEITITNSENGYLYGNGETFVEKATLQEVFDEIDGDLAPNGIMRIRFSSLETSDSVLLNYSHKVIIGGSARFIGSIDDTFITLSGGALELLGAELSSPTSCVIKVGAGATLTITSGTIAVDGAVSGIMQSTILNQGNLIINRGQIRYDSTTVGNAGQAIAQIGSNSTLTITESAEGSVICSGKTVLRLSGGSTQINGGTFSATSSDSSENGSAIKISNNAIVTVNGGTFQSVSLERTIVLAGNANSQFIFNGGTVCGNILFANGSPSNITSLLCDNKRIASSIYGNVKIYGDSNEITPDTARLDLVPTNGYYVTGWNNKSEINPLIADFESGETIVVKASNSYLITLKIGDITKELTLAYGTTFNPTDYEIDLPEGYHIVGWNDGTSTLQAPLQVNGTATYQAVLELSSPTPDTIQNVIKSYDGMGVTRTAHVEVVTGFEYTYTWQKKNIVNEWVDYENGKEIVFTSVLESGNYRLKVTATSGALSKTAYSNEFVVEISKGSYQGVVHAPFNGVYDSTKRLSSYTLESGFNWLNSAQVPTVNQKEYEAVYCLDAENYKEFHLTIVIDLEKAPAKEAQYPTRANNYKYSPTKTLADYPFNENGWRWTDESIVPRVGSNSYSAYYNPNRANYHDYETKVTLVIVKGDYEDVQDLAIDVKYVSDLTILYVIQNYKYILGAYSFDSSVVRATPLSELTTYTFPALYNADTANYNDYEGCNIVITVIKGNVTAKYNSNNTINIGGYIEGRELGEITLKNDWRWETPSIVPPAGTNKYYVIYNPNPAYYNDYRLEIRVIVDKGTVSGVMHPDLNGTYSPTKTLSDYTLNAGWSWVNPNETPVVNKEEYSAVFDSGSNYNLYYRAITLILEKATIDMSSITFADKSVIYDGESHAIAYTGNIPVGVAFSGYLPTSPMIEVGTYKCEALFTLTDTINYNAIDGKLEATLKIDKATYDMSGVSVENKEVVYDGNPHSLAIKGELPSGVTAIYHNNAKTGAGRYLVEVQFVQSDTKNYNLIPPMQGLLVIGKAKPIIGANEVYNFAYNGNVHVPSVNINNSEQTIAYESTTDLKKIGEHIIKYYVNESPNYLYAEKNVKVVINPTDISCGNVYNGKLTALIGKVTNTDEGFYAGSTLTMDISHATREEIYVNILLGGKSVEGAYTVNILLPEGASGTMQVYLKVDGEYRLLESRVGGNYLIFQTPALGEFKIVTDEAWPISDSALEWWAWLLISIAIAVVISGVAVVIVLYRQGKLPIDKIKQLFSKKVEVSNIESQNVRIPKEDESDEE